jgi:GGDEF domain-containing protein
VIELQEQLVAARETLRFEAMHDSLTQLLNRGATLEQLDREIVRASRRPAPITVVMADLDHFKAINDTFGHATGDVVLREAARRLKIGVRAYDSVGRLGGEEFIAVLPCRSARPRSGSPWRSGCASWFPKHRSLRHRARCRSPSVLASPPPINFRERPLQS